jgi:hypothetical protein
MVFNDRQFMHHDARGIVGPYTAVHAEGPWYAMAPEGVDVQPGSPVLQSGGFVGLRALMEEYGELFGQVGWASETSLFRGLRPGLHGEVGWVPMEQDA